MLKKVMLNGNFTGGFLWKVITSRIYLVISLGFITSKKSSLRALNDNWRKVFNSKKDIVAFQALESVITNPHKSISNTLVKDCRKYLIDFPEVFSYCQESLVDVYHQFDIRLLKQKTYNGKHADLYTYVFLF